MPFTNDEQAKIEINQARINDPAVRQTLFKQFAPVFHFTKTESNFPGNFEQYLKNVIEVKHEIYTRIEQNNERELTLLEKLELEAINDYFWKDNHFNPDYKERQNEPRFRALTDPVLFIQGVAEYKYRTLTDSSKERALTKEEKHELDLITKHCVDINSQFHWVGQMLCDLTYLDAKPSEEDLKQYQDSQYFITKAGLFYYSKLEKTLTEIAISTENFNDFKAAFPESKQNLSDDDYRVIKLLTDHSHKKYKNIPDELKTISPVNASQFLIFDEKHYGYKLGEKIDLLGVAPPGHPEFDALKPPAELAASIVPTTEGYYIQYDYFYPLNGAIPGLQWLRNWSPEAFSKLCKDFGLHYGDCEGVGIHIKVNATGEATFDFLQTFAHGSKGSRIVREEDCSFDEKGRVCVYVGEGPHPSYADNFVGRSKYLDRVDHAYILEPDHFIDVGYDGILVARELTNKHHQELPTNMPKVDMSLHKIREVVEKLPDAVVACERFADSNPLAHCGAKNPAEVVETIKKRNNYKPSLGLTNAWHKLMRHDTGHAQGPYKIPTPEELAAVKQALPEVEKLSPHKADYQKIITKLLSAETLLKDNTVKEHLIHALEEHTLDNLQEALFEPTAKPDKAHMDLLEITLYVNTIRTLFPDKEADHMIARLTSNDMKGKKSVQAMRIIEQTINQIEHHLKSKPQKLEQLITVKNPYRQAMYQAIFATIEKDTKISKTEYSKQLSTLNNDYLGFLNIDSNPRLRKLLMVMTNALTLLLTAGIANIVRKAISGRFFYFDQAKSKEKIDDMTHEITSKMRPH